MTAIDPKLITAASDYVANVRRRLVETLLHAKASSNSHASPMAQPPEARTNPLLPDRAQLAARARAASAALQSGAASELIGQSLLPKGPDDTASSRITSRYLADGESREARAETAAQRIDPASQANAAAIAPIRPEVMSLLSWLSSVAARTVPAVSGVTADHVTRGTARAELRDRRGGRSGSVGAAIAVALALLLAWLIVG